MENLTARGFVRIGQEQFNELYYQWIIDFKSNPFNFSDALYNSPTNNTFWVKKDWLSRHKKQSAV
jgi:hypothetical protein